MKYQVRRRLTNKEENFIKAFMKSNNATEAALEAYDCSTRESAQALGSTVLTKPHIQDAMEHIKRNVIDSVSDSLKKRGYLEQAIASAEADLTDPDGEIRENARNFLAKVAMYIAPHDNKKVTENKHVHLNIPKRD